MDHPFFDIVRDGCQEFQHAECIYVGTPTEDPLLQAEILREIVADYKNSSTHDSIDGIAVSVVNQDILYPAINEAIAAGIPVVTFDSDAPKSQRIGYVGTNNRFFGRELAKALMQLQRLGGTVGVIGDFNNSNNIQTRFDGFLWDIRQSGVWDVLPPPPFVEMEDMFTRLEELVTAGATAIALFHIEPMTQTNEWKRFVRSHRNITIVSIDSLDFQLRLLGTAFVDGLVGQIPFEMGYLSMELLHGVVAQGRESKEPIFVDTNLLIHLKVPNELPTLNVQANLIGRSRYIGYVMCGLVVLASLLCLSWTLVYRKVAVVTASQPLFLSMVAIGSIITCLSFIPSSFEDSGNVFSSFGELDLVSSLDGGNQTVLPCMAVPWLGLVGFCATYSALFGKTWRIKTIFQTGAFTRVTVRRRRVLIPLAAMLSLNILILTIWTAYEPQKYVRKAHPGTDEWNRIISTYGLCESPNPQRYLIPLGLVNTTVLVVGTWYAYEARNIETTFAESKYIVVAMGGILQACIIGIPILSFLRDEPAAYYLFWTSILFVTSMVTLGVVFIPKMIRTRQFIEMSFRTQREVVSEAIATTNNKMQKTQSIRSGPLSSTSNSKESGTIQEVRKVAFADPCTQQTVPKAPRLSLVSEI